MQGAPGLFFPARIPLRWERVEGLPVWLKGIPREGCAGLCASRLEGEQGGTIWSNHAWAGVRHHRIIRLHNMQGCNISLIANVPPPFPGNQFCAKTGARNKILRQDWQESGWFVEVSVGLQSSDVANAGTYRLERGFLGVLLFPTVSARKE
jgi:hypothetical protein